MIVGIYIHLYKRGDRPDRYIFDRKIAEGICENVSVL